MDLKVWLIFAVAIVVIVLGILTIVLNLKSKGKSVDYYALFIMGVIWAVAGFFLNIKIFSGIGLLFILIGLFKKSKWKENKKNWKRLNQDEKRLVLIMIIVLGLLVLAGVYILVLINNGTI